MSSPAISRRASRQFTAQSREHSQQVEIVWTAGLALEDDVFVDVKARHDLRAILPPSFRAIGAHILESYAALLH
jgi:hypothetical protein